MNQAGVYHLQMPADLQQTLPLVLDSPHSGRHYPQDFETILPQHILRRFEDSYVDQLFQHAPRYGAFFLRAEFPRSYIDPNRGPQDIDVDMLSGSWPTPVQPTEKTQQGYGLIWQRPPQHGPLYDHKLAVQTVQHRLETYWYPYHQQLARTLDNCYTKWGGVWHVNCHSMPSTSSPLMGKGAAQQRADFILGDLDGTSCAADFTAVCKTCLEAMGYKVAINYPYKGAEIVRRYGRPRDNHHSLQIEINRCLYLDEISCTKTQDFTLLQKNLNLLIATIAAFVSDKIIDRHKGG